MFSQWFSLIIFCCYYIGQSLLYEVGFYEYGEHAEGEHVSFIYNGIIPGFQPLYGLNVTPYKEELQPKYTYLRVEYYNMMSVINVQYDNVTHMLTFHIKFPFVDSAIGVLGYSLLK